MDKKKFFRKIFDVHVLAVAIFIIGIAAAIAAVTLTTYYPAPYGEYNVLRCMTSGSSFGRVEADAYFDEPSGYGTTSPPSYWMNINGSTISRRLSPTNPNEASRLHTLGVKRIFDIDSPPISASIWAPILDMNAKSVMWELELGGDLHVKGNVVIDGNLTMAKSTSTTTLQGPVVIANNKLFTRGVMIDDIRSMDGQVDFHNHVRVHGNVYKNRCKALVDTKDGKRSLTCIESPEIRFIDEGFAQLKNGVAKVKIDEILKNNIETDNYSVYLTLQDDCKGIWVSEKKPDCFIVKEIQNGKSNAKFTWMISGVRKGYEDSRFEPY